MGRLYFTAEANVRAIYSYLLCLASWKNTHLEENTPKGQVKQNGRRTQ